MKRKIYFFCSALLCGSIQGAMTPAGRALVPQVQPANPVAGTPAQYSALMSALHNKGKGHYVHATELPQSIAISDKQKVLEQEEEKTLALRASRGNM